MWRMESERKPDLEPVEMGEPGLGLIIAASSKVYYTTQGWRISCWPAELHFVCRQRPSPWSSLSRSPLVRSHIGLPPRSHPLWVWYGCWGPSLCLLDNIRVIRESGSPLVLAPFPQVLSFSTEYHPECRDETIFILLNVLKNDIYGFLTPCNKGHSVKTCRCTQEEKGLYCEETFLSPTLTCLNLYSY